MSSFHVLPALLQLPWHGDRMMGGWFLGWSLLGIIFWLAILALVVIAAMRLWQWRPGPGAGEPESALEILKRRYARGEIDREEFEAKKRDLGG